MNIEAGVNCSTFLYWLISISDGSKIGRVYAVVRERLLRQLFLNQINIVRAIDVELKTRKISLLIQISISRATPWNRQAFGPSKV